MSVQQMEFLDQQVRAEEAAAKVREDYHKTLLDAIRAIAERLDPLVTVQRLSLKPSDILVFRAEQHLTQEESVQLRNYLTEIGIENKAIILYGMSVSVLSKDSD
jgi:hypothetical protein